MRDDLFRYPDCLLLASEPKRQFFMQLYLTILYVIFGRLEEFKNAQETSKKELNFYVFFKGSSNFWLFNLNVIFDPLYEPISELF
jgi:hypothetical protein